MERSTKERRNFGGYINTSKNIHKIIHIKKKRSIYQGVLITNMAAAVTENHIYPCLLDSTVRSLRTFASPASADTSPRACFPPTTYSTPVPSGYGASKRDAAAAAAAVAAACTPAAAVGDVRASMSSAVSTAACHLSAVGLPEEDAYCFVGVGTALGSGTSSSPRGGSRQMDC